MSGKPIDEAVLDRACEAYAEIADDCMGLVRRRAMREALIAAQHGKAVAECHCATCTCAPVMTQAVRFDTSPAAQEGAVRDHLIALGWTPPGAQQTAARPPKPTECMNGCPDRQVCDHCQWPPGPDQQPAAVDEADTLLRDLVEALDAAFISSWQSTAAWQKQLDAAREYLATQHQEPKS